jgi:hypothetical protein
LGTNVAARHFEIFALESGIGIHRHHVEALRDGFAPHRALLFDRHAKAAQFEHRGGFARAEFHPALRYEIECGDAFGDAGRVIVGGRHQHDAVTEPNPLRALRAGGEKDLGRGGMGVFLQEVMLDLPGMIDAKPVGQFDLVERILEQLQFVAFVPRPRQLVLVENPELHLANLFR